MEFNDLRFVKYEDYQELVGLYHTARIALAGPSIPSKYDRMVWAAREWAKVHTYTTANGAYKDLSNNLFRENP